MTLGVLVVGPDEDTLLASGHSERSNAGHDICHNLTRLEQACDSLVLCIKLAVPVYLGVVEPEGTASLAHLDVHVVGPAKDLVGKGPKLILRADIIGLVDDGLDMRILIQKYLGDDVLVR